MRSRLRFLGVALLVISLILSVAVAYISYTIPSAFSSNPGFEALVASDAAFFALSIILLVASIIPSRKSFKARSETIVDQHDVVGETPEARGPVETKSQSTNQLTLLEMTLIRLLPQTTDEKRLSRLTAVDPQIISQKLDSLYDRGYITQDLKLTEKGFEILNSEGMKAASAQSGSTVNESPMSARLPSLGRIGPTRTDYYRIVAGLGILILVISLFAPWISDLSSGISLSLADLYYALIQALAQPAGGSTAASQPLSGSDTIVEVALLLSIVFYPLALILSSLALKYRRCAIAGGIFAIVTSLLFIFGFDSLNLAAASQSNGLGYSNTELITVGYGVYFEIVAGVLITVSFFVSRPT